MQGDVDAAKGACTILFRVVPEFSIAKLENLPPTGDISERLREGLRRAGASKQEGSCGTLAAPTSAIASARVVSSKARYCRPRSASARGPRRSASPTMRSSSAKASAMAGTRPISACGPRTAVCDDGCRQRGDLEALCQGLGQFSGWITLAFGRATISVRS